MRFHTPSRPLISRASLGPTRRRSWRRAPRLEALESRVALSTHTVTSGLDDGGSGTLRAVIAAAKSGDKVVFAAQLNGQTITLSQGELLITKSLTITGPAGGLDIDAGGQSRVFDISHTNSVVTLSGLTIRGGGNVEFGAGILDLAESLTLTNDYLVNNRAVGLHTGESAYGGGVSMDASNVKLTVNGGGFFWNVAQGADGGNGPESSGRGGDGMGGAILADDGTSVTIDGAVFFQNSAIGGNAGLGKVSSPRNSGGAACGGAIDTTGSGLSVSNTTFEYDRARGGDGSSLDGPPNSSSNSGGVAVGGGVAIGSPDVDPMLSFASTGVISTAAYSTETMTFTGGSFTSEDAQGGRGGINNSGTAGGVLNGSGGYAFGGAIYNASVLTPLLIKKTTFTTDSVQGGQGGNGDMGAGGSAGGTVGGAAVATFGDLTLTGADLSSNSAVAAYGGDGSGSGAGGAGGRVFGGAVFVNGSLSVTGSTLQDTLAFGGPGGAGHHGAGGSVIGGAIDSQAWGTHDAAPFPSGSIASSTFLDNTVFGGLGGSSSSLTPGDGGFVWGGDLCAFGAMAISAGTTFTGAQAVGGAGGFGANSVYGPKGGSVLGASLALLNGLPAASGVDVSDSLTNSTVQGAKGRGGDGGTGIYGGAGGDVQGGGIALSVAANSGSHLSVTVSNSKILNNTAQGGTGGWSYDDSSDAPGGAAQGGGLFVDASSVVALSGGTITGNQAEGGPWGKQGTFEGLGGGVYLAGAGSTKKKTTTISGNSASTGGTDVFGMFS